MIFKSSRVQDCTKTLERNEVEEYFNCVLREIDESEPGYLDAIKNYGLLLCREALERAANLLAEIYPATDYDNFNIWTGLSDVLYLLEIEESYYTHPEPNHENKQT